MAGQEPEYTGAGQRSDRRTGSFPPGRRYWPPRQASCWRWLPLIVALTRPSGDPRSPSVVPIATFTVPADASTVNPSTVP